MPSNDMPNSDTPNSDTRAARRYHDGTKHPGGHLMDPRHAFDPMRQPMLFKIYADLKALPLHLDTTAMGMSALQAISPSGASEVDERVPDAGVLARLLHYSAGITKRIRGPWGETPFRAAACTGALYHIELYLVCEDIPGLDAGVYHFSPRDSALTRLRAGDHRRTLIEASADEPGIAAAPAIIVLTDVRWRNACKYQAREYRHAFWDSGTILANTLALASAHGMPASVVAGFADDRVSELLDLDTGREVALALVPVGRSSQRGPGPAPGAEPLALRTVPISDYETDFPAIREMHAASSLGAVEVAPWRAEAPLVQMSAPLGELTDLDPYPAGEMAGDPIERVIVRRGSTRRFAREPIGFRQLSTILDRSTQGVPADFLPTPGDRLRDAYLIVNAVEGLAPGAYVYRRDLGSLELLKEGDFRNQAGRLGLGQALPADASVIVFLMSDLRPILERFGNRGYRAAQLEASITAGRLYLAAYAHRLGATGLTFYDDDVTDFFSPHARGRSVMFMVALGAPARRGRP